MSDSKPVGKRFADVYAERGIGAEDSASLRGRLGHFIANLNSSSTNRIAATLREETGRSVYPLNVVEFFDQCTLHQLLNSVTSIYQALSKPSPSEMLPPRNWVEFAQRAFKEENVAYTVDERGGVHPTFDEEFDAARRATIAMLEKPRYSAALKDFDDAIADMKQPRDTRDAVRKTFESVENVAKLMSPKIARLGATEVLRILKPIAIERLAGTERDVTSMMIASLAEWVNACQPYRHAQGVEEPQPPSLDLAIWMVSTGAAHLRWLVGVDQLTQGADAPTAS